MPSYWRIFAFSLWLTFGFHMLLSSQVMGADGELPQHLGGTGLLLLGFWLAALLAGLLSELLRGQQSLGQALVAGIGGYCTAVMLRLLMLGQFLPGSRYAWTLFWDALRLRGLPDYPLFLLLSFLVGGIILAVAALLLGLLSLPRLNLDVPLRRRPGLMLESLLPAALALMLVGGLLIVLLLNDLRPAVDLQLQQTRLLSHPAINILLATLVGMLLGLAYRSPNWGAALADSSGGVMLHVVLMLLFSSSFAAYDSSYSGLNPAQLHWPSFLLLWLGAPLAGGIAAFAMYNLRDTLARPYQPLEQHSA